MDIPSSFGYLIATAHDAAAEIRTLGDYDRAQLVLALRAAIATERLGQDPIASELRNFFLTEAWRLARH
jgi:hypothetical protein